jgi:cytochrome-b5 reductase
MQPDLQIQRAYTVCDPLRSLSRTRLTFLLQPLSATAFDLDGPAHVDLVVKRYPDGEASRYMHRLHPGDELHVRGPIVTWDYRPDQFDEIVFVRLSSPFLS